ncbi:NapC/NirT family cytochrome c [Marinifilum fragile]|uniref:cytochrome c3 family protein n=1 Tax=Marinifilum fragile TaxID=570161 RepID=UPI002AA76D43|nr:NapC/NirT family cytochrome c [Marinifilum fragile]
MKLPKSFYNWTSVLGASIATIAFFLIVFFFVISVIFDQGSSYMGLIIYIVLPVIMVIGMILIPIGMILQIRKRSKLEFITGTQRWPRVDLNDQKHRNAFSLFVIISFIFLFLSSIGSYEAFVYSESVAFCGTLCHEVMEPEYVTYQQSAHARVACVECHVGEGADWFVRSKLSGLYQVYAVISDNFPRPVPTPIANLRPAQETCEHCHWPEKFYPKRFKKQRNFLADSLNTEWNIQLLMKTGPDHHTQQLSEGIHWHINPNIKIEFMTTDEKNEFIQWVKYTNLKTGEEHIYKDQMMEPDSTFYADAKLHTMDCMDCHNRPSHVYLSPPDFIDIALADSSINNKIPFIKMAAMEALKSPYSTKDSANLIIEQTVLDFYKEKYPKLSSSFKEDISQAIEGIKKAYHNNNFPAMKVRWDVYPDHKSHMESQGCFRCHDNMHATEEGRIISKDCNLCHTITSQGKVDSLQFAISGKSLEFKHPVDIGTDWKDYNCTECHAYLYP